MDKMEVFLKVWEQEKEFFDNYSEGEKEVRMMKIIGSVVEHRGGPVMLLKGQDGKYECVLVYENSIIEKQDLSGKHFQNIQEYIIAKCNLSLEEKSEFFENINEYYLMRKESIDIDLKTKLVLELEKELSEKESPFPI